MNYRAIKKNSQRGIALVLVLSMTAVLLVLGSIGTKLVMESQQNTVSVFAKHGQAANIAQAGLQEGVGWFKQNTPVKQSYPTDLCKDAAFKPQSNFVEPELHATDNQVIGIVKDIPINNNVYGRYILRRQQDCNDPELPNTVKDISAKRGKNNGLNNAPNIVGGDIRGDGNVWYLESEGVVYRRQDKSKDVNGIYVKGPEDPPNKVISRASASVEIVRLSVNVDPAPLMLFGTTGTNHNFGSNCNISGTDSLGNAAQAVYYNGLVPNVSAATRSPSSLGRASRSPISVENVFSVTQDELRGTADNVYSTLTQVPEKIGFSITYLDGNFTFTPTKPLFGGGLIYVNGDLNLQAGSQSIFSGVIYVNGTLTISRDNTLSGVVIARRIDCSPGSGRANIEFNRSLITSVTQRLALYRENNLSHVIREIK